MGKVKVIGGDLDRAKGFMGCLITNLSYGMKKWQ